MNKINTLMHYWVTGGLFIFLSGYFYFPTAKSHNNSFYVFVLVPVILYLAPILRKTQLWHCRALALLLTYLGYFALSSFWLIGEADAHAYKPWAHAGYLLAFLLAASYVAITDIKMLQKVIWATIAIAAISALISILVWLQQGLWGRRLEGLSRTSQAIQAPAVYATLLLFCAAVIDFKQMRRWAITGIIAAMTVFVAYIVLAQSRGVIIGLSLAMLVLFVCRRQWQVVAAVCLPSALLGLVAAWSVELAALANGLGRGEPWRKAIWQQSWQLFLQAPVIGHGYLHEIYVELRGRSFQHTHNIYLGHLVLGGVIGLALYLAMLAYGFVVGWYYRAQPMVLAAWVSIICTSVYLLSNMSRVIGSPREAWLYLWVPLLFLLVYPFYRRLVNKEVH